MEPEQRPVPRLLNTGSRNWSDQEAIAAALRAGMTTPSGTAGQSSSPALNAAAVRRRLTKAGLRVSTTSKKSAIRGLTEHTDGYCLTTTSLGVLLTPGDLPRSSGRAAPPAPSGRPSRSVAPWRR